jgi:hypothetical protein
MANLIIVFVGVLTGEREPARLKRLQVEIKINKDN